MKNSEKFKLKLNINRAACIIVTLLTIYLFIKYIVLDLVPFFHPVAVIIISICMVLGICVCSVYYLINLNNLLKKDITNVLYELDYKLDKAYEKFGLYITENYIVCIGNWCVLFKMFIISIKDIDAIDTYHDSRFFYKKKSNKSGFLSFIKASIKTDIMDRDNDMLVFNIICGKKVYCVTTASSLNKLKIKKINEMADYICDKYNHIDYI